MGASQSSCPPPTPADADEDKGIRPHGLARNSKYIQLNSSYYTLYGGIVSLVKHNKYADLLIICGDDQYPVHRAIVCPRSKVLEDKCAAREGERDYASPAKPTKIWFDPSELDSHILAAVLNFLYTLDYSASGMQALIFGLPEEVEAEGDDHSTAWDDGDDEDEVSVKSVPEVESTAAFSDAGFTPSSSASSSSQSGAKCPDDLSDRPNELVFHVQVYAAGHHLGIASLCDVAKEKLSKRLCSNQWREEIIGCIREVYRHRTGAKMEKLREVVVKSARSRFRTLKVSDGWKDLILDFPEFAEDILSKF